MAFAPVVGEFFIKLAEERGLYERPSERVGAILSALSSLVASRFYQLILVGLAGVALGVWVDWIYRRFERRRKPTKPLKREVTKEEMLEAHRELEKLKARLEADDESSITVSYSGFHEVVAMMIRLGRMGIPIPFSAEHADMIQYENFNKVMFRYFASISPFLRNGDLLAARAIARTAIGILAANPDKDDAKPGL